MALKSTTSFPFGIWFANASTLYVADEGNGDNTFSAASGSYTSAAAQTTAGLQKWVRDGDTWKFAYTLAGGLNLGHPYTVPGYPTGDNPAIGLPWSPATDGLRNITGRVNRDGTVTIWGHLHRQRQRRPGGRADHHRPGRPVRRGTARGVVHALRSPASGRAGALPRPAPGDRSQAPGRPASEGRATGRGPGLPRSAGRRSQSIPGCPHRQGQVRPGGSSRSPAR
jgi:hypothetical protein